MFYASLIGDTFRVRLDAHGVDLQQLRQAINARSSDKTKAAGKPWKFNNIMDRIPTGPNQPAPKIELKQVSSSSSDRQSSCRNEESTT